MKRKTIRSPHLTLTLAAMGLLAIFLLLASGADAPVLAVPSVDVIKVPDDFATIQAAIDAAADGDTILVAEGIYKENLSVTEGITLTGGWDPAFSTQDPGSSAILGQGLGRVISITCASSDTVVTVDGFTVEQGNATGLGSAPAVAGVAEEPLRSRWAPAPDPLPPAEHVARLQGELASVVAGGLYPGGPAAYEAMLARVERQIAQLQDAQARPEASKNPSQEATDCGGGIYSWNASLHLLNSTILGNLASLDGDGCGGGVFVGQAAPDGAVIRDNTLRENIASAAPTAVGLGGGLHAIQAPGLVVEGNVFQENAATSAGLLSVGQGGGLFVDASSDTTVRDNRFIHNTANGGWESLDGLGGGAVLRQADGATVARNLFHENLGVLHGQGGGGGLAVLGSEEVVLAENEVTRNWGTMFQMDRAGAGGGGIALYSTAHITMTGNVIRDNTATVSGAHVGFTTGGGLDGQQWHNAWITGNIFTGNVACLTGAGRGGGASLWAANDSEVAGNTFADNAANLDGGSGAGGGLFLVNTMDVAVRGNRLQDNLASGGVVGHGGGLCVWSEGPHTWNTTVEANLFLDNRAGASSTDWSEGGACSIGSHGLTFTNNVLAGNTARLGGGLYVPSAEGALVTNNTLAGNSGTAIVLDQWNRTPVTLTNNIVVSHTVGISVTEGATATVRYTLWEGNGVDIAGPGTINHTHPVTGDPAFADPAEHDYHLSVGSAAINAADPAGVPPAPDHDADDVARPVGAAVDLGAYEWQGYWRHLPYVAKNWKPSTGWAAGDSLDGYGVIIHTADDGQTWVRQGSAGEIPDVGLTRVAAVDAQNAWVVGQSAGGYGVILRTYNGGQTWQRQGSPWELPDAEFFGIYAVDGNTAWVAGNPGVILQTTDGGQTWSRYGEGTVPPHAHLEGVYASDADHVWVVGSEEAETRGLILRTTDGGAHWTKWTGTEIPELGPLGQIDIHGADANTVWSVGHQMVFHTTDGGLTWVTQQPPIAGFDINGVHAVDHSTLWVVVDAGGIFRSDDGGAHWTKQTAPPGTTGDYIMRISAVDAQTAWAVTAYTHPGAPGHVLHTADGGQNWVVQTIPVSPSYWGVSFVR